VASEYIESESRFKYAMEGSDSPPSCSPCDSGKYSGFGAMTCSEDCPPGSMLSGTDCTSCPVGQFSAVANSKECTVCPEGKFSGAPYDGNMDDTDGPGLNYEKSLNVSGATRCGVCYHQRPSANKGFNGYRVVEISRGVANCSLCPAGKQVYFGQDNKGRLSNQNKDGGFFENLAFQGSDVTSWMYGQWNEASDPNLFPAATCAKCEPGKFSNESTMLAGIDGEDGGGSKDCIACPWNSVPSPLQDSCVRCPEGTTSAPVGMFPIEHVDKAGTACRSVGGSVVALVFNFLFAIAYTVYACTDDRFCFNKCKSKTRVNVPAKVIAVVWMFWGLLTLSFNLLLVDTLVNCFFPFVFLFCTSFCVMCGKSMQATERDMLTKKVVFMEQEAKKGNAGSM